MRNHLSSSNYYYCLLLFKGLHIFEELEIRAILGVLSGIKNGFTYKSEYMCYCVFLLTQMFYKNIQK